jgi:transcriptional regulator with XRE-family HTH domain
MKKTYHQRARRAETLNFRVAVRQLRTKMGWTQTQLGARLSVSRRTLSHWENGFWLPPFKQRLHVVLALREAPPEYVLEIADALGVSLDPLVKPLLQTFEDALDASIDAEQGVIAQPPVAVVAAPEPPRPRPAPTDLRAAVDAVVREVADALDARPNAVRAAIVATLQACRALGANLDEVITASSSPPKVDKKADA